MRCKKSLVRIPKGRCLHKYDMLQTRLTGPVFLSDAAMKTGARAHYSRLASNTRQVSLICSRLLMLKGEAGQSGLYSASLLISAVTGRCGQQCCHHLGFYRHIEHSLVLANHPAQHQCSFIQHLSIHHLSVVPPHE